MTGSQRHPPTAKQAPNGGIPIGDHARRRAAGLVEVYRADLLAEAETIARRRRAPAVGRDYLDEAATSLSPAQATSSRVQSMLGGTLLGGGVSGLVAMGMTSSYPFGAVLVVSCLSTIGAFLIGNSSRRWR